MILKSAIQIHLTLKDHKAGSGKTIESCLTAALAEARYCTGRDIESGVVIDFSKTGNWLGAMCYMTILDQIGTCYKPIDRFNEDGSTIEKALKYFTLLEEDEIKALYALRNAFFHDFSLFNLNNNRPKYQHRFTVYSHPANKVVLLPKTNWSGKLNDISSENTTHVNLKALGDLVESVYKYILELDGNNKLAIILKGGEIELLNRFTFSQ